MQVLDSIVVIKRGMRVRSEIINLFTFLTQIEQPQGMEPLLEYAPAIIPTTDACQQEVVTYAD